MKDAADPAAALVLRQMVNDFTIDAYFAGVRRHDAGDDVHQRRLAGAITADDRDEVTGLQG
ncbi:hypothetical protein D3C85_1701890 [compost metagenome]